MGDAVRAACLGGTTLGCPAGWSASPRYDPGGRGGLSRCSWADALTSTKTSCRRVSSPAPPAHYVHMRWVKPNTDIHTHTRTRTHADTHTLAHTNIFNTHVHACTHKHVSQRTRHTRTHTHTHTYSLSETHTHTYTHSQAASLYVTHVTQNMKITSNICHVLTVSYAK